MIVCAGEIEQFEFAYPIGIGMVDAAVNLTRLCLTEKPESVLFVGTAGSYGRIDLIKIVVSQKACNIEHSLIRGDGYSPIDNCVNSIGKVSHETTVNSSNYITTNELISDEYIKRGIGLENMEFYGVMKVAKQLEIPAKGIFVTTNYCAKNAHTEFKNNHKTAMIKLEKYIAENGLLEQYA